MDHRIAVIGAGAVGLSAAVSVQQRVRTAKVTLIADRFDEGTTSWGAGGIFRLDLDHFPLKDRDKIRQWCTESWKFYTGLARSEQAHESGMTFVSGTLLQQTPKESGYSLMAELTHDFQAFNESQMKRMNMPVLYKYGYGCTTVITHVPTYLKWLMQKFREGGGVVECRQISELAQLCDDYDVVVNCSGLKSMDLCRDESLFPVMGHILKVKAPWFNKFFFCEELYIIPHDDYIILGGIRDSGNWNLAADPINRNILLSRAYTIFPHLKHAPVVGEWVGLRPGRKSVRLELELIKCGQKKSLPVIHNYGHGGHGISLSWGCAADVARQVQEIVSGLRPRL